MTSAVTAFTQKRAASTTAPAVVCERVGFHAAVEAHGSGTVVNQVTHSATHAAHGGLYLVGTRFLRVAPLVAIETSNSSGSVSLQF